MLHMRIYKQSSGEHLKIIVAALYHFAKLDHYRAMREPLQQFCIGHGIKGSLLLADEGINGTVAGSREDIDALLVHLRSDARLQGLEHKESAATTWPFYRMKVCHRLNVWVPMLSRKRGMP